jgi:very-short-patch-repair endonuclease
MTLHFNTIEGKQIRRSLRHNLPKAEAVLWTHLSRRQMLGYKFRRQYGVDRYILDFYCPELKLAIEVDGESHFTETVRAYDRKRQAHIESFGIRFLRMKNADVLTNLHGVLDMIANQISEIKSTSGFVSPS